MTRRPLHFCHATDNFSDSIFNLHWGEMNYFQYNLKNKHEQNEYLSCYI